ncbi:MAG: hypothetical protein WC254_05730 [Candidatus Woesearchaeota archaeon]|jgi:hypothetical protein
MLTREQYVEKILLGISFTIRALILIETVTAAWNKDLLLVFLSLGVLILTFTPSFIAKNLKINLPIEFEFLVFIFISGSMFFGEIFKFYHVFWWWDLFLHALSAILLGFGGFLSVYIMYTEKRIRTSPRFIIIFAFCFALAIGALWEITEFSIDQILGWNMQKSGLIDTMTDLIVDAAGALLVSIGGYFYLKRKEPTGIFEKFLKRFIEKNPRLFRKKLRK